MKKTLLLIAAALSFAGCGAKHQVELIPAENFNTEVDGKPVSLYTLHGGDITMQVTNFGARVVSLWTPDKNGSFEDVVLGYNNIEDYVHNQGERFLGAVVGPYANRIAGGTFTVGDQVYNFPLNNNGQTLHGGLKGVDMLVWDVCEVTDSSIVLHLLHPDGLDGFPGNIDIRLSYLLDSENNFVLNYRATTDKATYFNISHHPFFNLKGEGNGTILDNEMIINASAYIPIDEYSIPYGEIAPVEGTPFDFRKTHTIGERIGEKNEQLANGAGYDHNFCIDRKTESGVEFDASVYEPKSGRFLEVFSDQPGLQFYSGNFFDGTTCGKYGKPLRYRESIALETQHWPDSPHHPNFPSTLLEPGQTYTQTCIYRFSVK